MSMFVFSGFLCICVSDTYRVIGTDTFVVSFRGEWRYRRLIFRVRGRVVCRATEVLVGIEAILKGGS